MKILAFGIAREIVGAPVIEIDWTHGMTAAALKKALISSYGQLGQLSSLMIAVNGKYADDNIQVAEKDEVAIIPPVSGG